MKKASSKQKKAVSKKKGQTMPAIIAVLSHDATCPECHAVINIEGEEIGDYLECETCFAELTVTSLEPPNVTVVDEEK